MIHRSIAPRPISVQELVSDPKIHWSIAPTVPRIRLRSDDPSIHRSITPSVPRIRLWSDDPSIHRSQTNICPKNVALIQRFIYRALCSKNKAMIRWSIAPSLQDPYLSKNLENTLSENRFPEAKTLFPTMVYMCIFCKFFYTMVWSLCLPLLQKNVSF